MNSFGSNFGSFLFVVAVLVQVNCYDGGFDLCEDDCNGNGQNSLNVRFRNIMLDRCLAFRMGEGTIFHSDFEKAVSFIQYLEADEDAYYSVVLYKWADRSDISTFYLEWGVSSLPGRDLIKGDLSKGYDCIKYKQADPNADEQQNHEFVLMRQTVDYLKIRIPETRCTFDFQYFLTQQNGKLLDPEASLTIPVYG